MNDLHAQIMNLPCNARVTPWTTTREAYGYGHRDARHAAAELALKVVAQPVQPADKGMKMTSALLQGALDALEEHQYARTDKALNMGLTAINALRAAIAQPVQQADECYCDANNIGEPNTSCGDCPKRDYKTTAQLVQPAGWKLVPLEPTPEMLRAAIMAPIPAVMLDSYTARQNLMDVAHYKAMISAAPNFDAAMKPAQKEMTEGEHRALNAALLRSVKVLDAAQPVQPAYPVGQVVGPCVCGSWPGGECLKCTWIPAQPVQPAPKETK